MFTFLHRAPQVVVMLFILCQFGLEREDRLCTEQVLAQEVLVVLHRRSALVAHGVTRSLGGSELHYQFGPRVRQERGCLARVPSDCGRVRVQCV
jgi:hypothetical protein